MTVFNKLEKILGKNKVKQNVNLSPYLTLRTKTIARFYFEANTREDLVAAKKASLETSLPMFMIGGGSNMVIAKPQLVGLIVRNRYMVKKIVEDNGTYIILSVSSGYPASRLVKETTDQGLSGFEFQLGLPGTVGGAIYMNSKWTHPLTYFGDNLIKACLIDSKAQVKTVDRNYFHFAYDYSILQKTKEILLEAEFKMKRTDPNLLKKQAKEALDYRKKTQPMGVFSSGCFFRNISVDEMKKISSPTTSAGYLIDKAGLKGKSVGNFVVSDVHANFIINKGEGNPKDLVELVKIIKDRVKEKFGITLNEEVLII